MNRNQKVINRLKQSVGEDVYTKIIDSIGGETVYFPVTETGGMLEDRNKQIKARYYSGADVSRLAEIYDLSESQIRRIINARNVE